MPNTAAGTESQRIPTPIGGGIEISSPDYGIAAMAELSESRNDSGLNELRRRLRDRLRWNEDAVRRIKIALELLEDDEAYRIYDAIASTR